MKDIRVETSIKSEGNDTKVRTILLLPDGSYIARTTFFDGYRPLYKFLNNVKQQHFSEIGCELLNRIASEQSN